jgi:hypothetical protein
VIDEFRAAGIPLAYSDRLVPGSLRVEAEPASREPLALLREVLQPHGLAHERSSNTWLVVRAAPALAPAKPGSVTVFVLTVEGTVPTDARVVLDAPAGASRRLASGVGTLADVVPGRHVVTVEAEGFLTERSVVVVAPGEAVRISMYLAPLNPRLDEVTVTASRYDLVREVAPSTAYFSRAEIESLSDFNNDVLRVAQRLPGTAALELSSRSHIRGGAEDEMAVRFDGVELVAPFHLEDYQSVFSAIDDRIVAGIQVYSGGFPAAYGGALSGLMLVEPRTASEPLAHELG